ncbi:IcmL/DotI homolog [Legionella beliardensis]|uniref:IcmL/DotI homolog n=1 Tax=Legionella beliardensis TaxID=91822 RepID=A0A378HXM3_9GAMM|nr:DotI/IcmL family type IV secretion protein [Legionella beliardensis]STX27647.1 IcmL/DotI homolog [Legionella beliardensis]
MRQLIKLTQVLLLVCPLLSYADDTQLAVWANEAIVATYTYSYSNFIQRQRDIARYFTAQGWTAYSNALNASKLPEAIMKNNYFVSAVATMPPAVKSLGQGQWQATMPVLVVYKNPQYQQKQTLEVTINFNQAPSGQGVRGLAINSLKAKVIEPPCECKPSKETGTEPPLNAPQ